MDPEYHFFFELNPSNSFVGHYSARSRPRDFILIQDFRCTNIEAAHQAHVLTYFHGSLLRLLRTQD
jgi:hypothetical protein